MNRSELDAIINDITYKDWSIYVDEKNTNWYLYVAFLADGDIQKGRKWYVSPHSTRSEVVQTALLAILTAEEHEARETFRYKGAKIFGPHIDVDFLVESVKVKRNLDIRPEAGEPVLSGV